MYVTNTINYTELQCSCCGVGGGGGFNRDGAHVRFHCDLQFFNEMKGGVINLSFLTVSSHQDQSQETQ